MWLKSNLNLLDSTKDPFWITWVPKTLLSDSWSKCVAEWYALILSLLETFIWIFPLKLFHNEQINLPISFEHLLLQI